MPGFAIDGLTIALVLLAALLHASWNGLARASGDPLVNVAVVTTTGGVIALPFLFLLPLPTGETWRWLAASALVHFVYQLGLARMYRLGELSQVYPIARGLAPLGVAMLAALFLCYIPAGFGWYGPFIALPLGCMAVLLTLRIIGRR